MSHFAGETDLLVSFGNGRSELMASQHPINRPIQNPNIFQLSIILTGIIGAVFVLSVQHPILASLMQYITAQVVTSVAPVSRKSESTDEESIRDIANKALQALNENIITVPKNECKVTVLITRHCNDYGVYAMNDGESGDKHCSFVGYERTEYFAMKFESHTAQSQEDINRRWPMPSALYALLPVQGTQNGGINYRQIEMLLPLAKRTHVPIQVVATADQVGTSIHEKLQRNGNICGQVMVVAWKHRFIPDVAAALGCGPDQGCYKSYPDEEFDQVWQLRFIYEPPAPKDEVLRLLDEDSFLLQDDYGILAQQKKWQEDLLDLEGNRDSRYQHPSANTGWTVYGGRTNQEFDPLQSEYHKDTI